jgi:predicted ATPase
LSKTCSDKSAVLIRLLGYNEAHCFSIWRTILALLQIEVDSFRAFRDKAKFGISPLTLLYGFNQAGKSTLLRLLPFLADSIYEQGGPVDLTSPALSSARFDELGWLGKAPSYTPQIGLEVNGAALLLQLRNENGLIVNRVQIHQGSECIFDVRWDQTTVFARPVARTTMAKSIDI